MKIGGWTFHAEEGCCWPSQQDLQHTVGSENRNWVEGGWCARGSEKGGELGRVGCGLVIRALKAG